MEDPEGAQNTPEKLLYTHLVDEGHGVDQQLGVHSIFLLQDLHCIEPRLAA